MSVQACIWGEGEDLYCTFSKIKSVLILENKVPDCVHPWVKFFIKNVVLRVFRTKDCKILTCGAFFYVCLTKSFWKCPNSPALIISSFTPASIVEFSWFNKHPKEIITVIKS